MIICLMGPTASGKTPLAVQIAQHFPCEIISVDSAMVYRGMDIGTAKPDETILKIAPHHLINIRDPRDSYSAGDFRKDALMLIDEIIKRNKIPLLVGGTMMYFKILQSGIANLPSANQEVRDDLQDKLNNNGLDFLYQQLKEIDPITANKINMNDSQRIMRAIEVHILTGKTLSVLQQEEISPLLNYPVLNIGLMPANRAWLHERIAERLNQMLTMGFVDEVKQLMARGDLSLDLPSMRSVGYHECWRYLNNEMSYAITVNKILAATRQLAKRQMTWLRSWQAMSLFEADHKNIKEQIFSYLRANNE